MRILAFATALCLLSTMAASQASLTPDWTTILAEEGPVWQSLRLQARDASGNCYLGGEINGDFAVRKVGPDAKTLWTMTVDGPGRGVDTLASLAVDSVGKVFGVGGVIGFLVSPDGELRWTRRTQLDTKSVVPQVASFDALGNPTFLALNSGKVLQQRLDASTGNATFTKSFSHAFTKGARLSNGDFLYLDGDGRARRVRSRDGAEVWVGISTIPTPNTSLITGPNMRFIAAHSDLGANPTTKVLVCNGVTGATINATSLEGNFPATSPATLAPDGTAYLQLATPTGLRVTALSPSTNGTKWVRSLNAATSAFGTARFTGFIAANASGVAVSVLCGEPGQEQPVLAGYSPSGVVTYARSARAIGSGSSGTATATDDRLFAFGDRAEGYANLATATVFDFSNGTELIRAATPAIGERSLYPSNAIALSDGGTAVASATDTGINLSSLDASGLVRWIRTLDNTPPDYYNIAGSPWRPVHVLEGPNLVVFGILRQGNLHVFDRKTGQPLGSQWTDLNGFKINPIGMFVVQTGDGDAVAIGPAVGEAGKTRYTRFSLTDFKVRWSYTTLLSFRGLSASARVSEDLIALGAYNGTALLNIHSGRILWTDANKSAVALAYSKSAGLVGLYYTTSGLEMAKFALSTGAPMWTTRIAAADGTELLLGKICVVGDRLLMTGAANTSLLAMAYSSANGQVLWRRDLGTESKGGSTDVIGFGTNRALIGIRTPALVKVVQIEASTGDTSIWYETLERSDGQPSPMPVFFKYDSQAVGMLTDLPVAGATEALRRAMVARFTIR